MPSVVAALDSVAIFEEYGPRRVGQNRTEWLISVGQGLTREGDASPQMFQVTV